MKYTLEICAGSLHSALAAQEGGADRVELCNNLSEGGTTPSYGMVKICNSLLDIPVFPIIRPRGGDFVYSNEEFQVMKEDVISCKGLGCEGIVLGILKANGEIDTERCSELISLSGKMQITFHRAFDHCCDLEKGLEDVISLGCHRLLTSGGAMYAENALSQLKRLIIHAGNRIIIMPGSGLTEENLLKIATETGAHEFHSTAKKRIFRHPDIQGQNSIDSNYLYETDASKVKNMMQVLSLIDN